MHLAQKSKIPFPLPEPKTWEQCLCRVDHPLEIDAEGVTTVGRDKTGRFIEADQVRHVGIGDKGDLFVTQVQAYPDAVFEKGAADSSSPILRQHGQ